MNISDFITERYCRIDDALPDLPHHPQAILSLGEVITIGVLYAIKGVSRRAFYQWLKDNYGDLFPQLPERTRLFRRLQAQSGWTGCFLAQPTILGVADSYGIELGHPVRAGRNLHQVGQKGKSNHRWIVGANSASCSTNWAASSTGTAPPPMSMTNGSCPCCPAMTVK
jgi:hypothetical protein